MLTISAPSPVARPGRTMPASSRPSKRNWSREQQGHSEWHGKLAGKWGLQGVGFD